MLNRTIGSVCIDDSLSVSSSFSENDLTLGNERNLKFPSNKALTVANLSKHALAENQDVQFWPSRWPNSLEDRDNKSSSNAPVSASLSDSGDQNRDEFCNNLISLSTPIQRQKATVENSFENEDECGDCESDNVFKSDSLPRHRERLSRKKRNKQKGSRSQLKYSSSSSSSNSKGIVSEIDDRQNADSVENISDLKSSSTGEIISSKSNSDTSLNGRKNVCGSGKLYSTLDNVGSWLALQKFPSDIPTRPCRFHSQSSPDSNTFVPRTQYDVVFNVSGQHFIVDTRTLSRFPNTMLGSESKRAKYWDKKRNEYFLDRHRATFEVMLNFYKSSDGVLHRPDEIPIDVFIHEVKYYQFDRDIVKRFLEMEGILRQVKKKELPENPVKREIWKLFEDPESSCVARLVTSISALVIAISVCVFCVETVPSFESWGHAVNESLEPAVESCRYRLQNSSQLFDSHKGIFKPSTEKSFIPDGDRNISSHNDRKRSLGSDDTLSWLKLEANPPRVSYFHRVKEELEYTDTPTTSVTDTFDSNLVIFTLQNMLKECIASETNNSYNYFTMRCAIELNDGLWYSETTPIHHILRHIEVHDDDHEHEDDHHSDGGELDEFGDHEEVIDKKQLKNWKKKNVLNKIFNKNLTRAHKIVNQDPKRRRRTINQRLVNNFKLSNTTKRLTLDEASRALLHVCRQLDIHSVRSSYAWYVLEASLDGPAGLLFLIESSCIVWFVIELGLRFVCCPNMLKFCMNFLNIIDAIAIMPYFITLVVTSLHTDSNLRPQTATILRTIRLVRMLRILKLSRHSRGLRILGLTLLRSTRVLVLLVCFQMVLAVTFSSIVYNVEFEVVGSNFESIPAAFWWALITMTTVGYGDVVPITPAGKLTGAFCAIMGILGIAFPVPVIVSNFNYLYNLDRDDCKLDPEELMEDPMEHEAKLMQEKFEKFEESLFDAVRKNVGSMSSGPADSTGGQNPADLWNQTRRQYRQTTNAMADKRRKSAGDQGKTRLAKGVTAIATASLMSTAMPLKTTTANDQSRRQKATSI